MSNSTTDDWNVLADYADEHGMRDEVVDSLRDPCMEWIGEWVCIYGVNFNFVGRLVRLTSADVVLERVHQIDDVESLQNLSCRFFAEVQCFNRALNGNFGPAAWAKPEGE